MKYWWLNKYKHLVVKMIPNLIIDLNYFLIMPKNYLKLYEKIKLLPVSELKEQELLINLYVLINSKNLKDNRVLLIIDELLKVPDTNLPISDYSLKDIIEEIKNLKNNLPIQEKLDFNNIAACYTCRQIFYIDKITSVNKRGYCLCPFCRKPTIYFDNDYIPMNTSFIKLASLYYNISPLGCNYLNIKKLLKKNVEITISNIITTSTVIENSKRRRKQTSYYVDCSCLEKKKISSLEEEIILKNYYDCFHKLEEEIEYETTIIVPEIREDRMSNLCYLLVLSIMDILSKSVYLKKIKIICPSLSSYQLLSTIKKTICTLI